MSSDHDNKPEKGLAAIELRRRMALSVQEALTNNPAFLALDPTLTEALKAVAVDIVRQTDIDAARIESAGGSFLLEILDNPNSPELMFKAFGSISLHNLGHVMESVADILAREHIEKHPEMEYERARLIIATGATCMRVMNDFSGANPTAKATLKGFHH